MAPLNLQFLAATPVDRALHLDLMTYLPIVEACDNYRPSRDASLVPFYLSLPPTKGQLIGLLKPIVLTAIEEDTAHQGGALTIHSPPGTSTKIVAFSDSCTTSQARSDALREIVLRWREAGTFAGVIGGRLWRNELYGVYANPFVRTPEPALVLERSACALFGIVTYGVHMTVFTHDFKVWVPRRSKTKQTWGGYLDNTVAGGMPVDLSPMETIVKEAEEEANLDEAFVRQHTRSVGITSYFFQTKAGWLQPEVEYIYELKIPEGSDVVPRPNDDEVESFSLYTIDEIKRSILNSEYKPNCAIVLLDFLMRHGFVTPDNEPNLLEITTRMNGRFEWDIMEETALREAHQAVARAAVTSAA